MFRDAVYLRIFVQEMVNIYVQFCCLLNKMEPNV